MIATTLEEVLDGAITARLQSVWTALPGRVLAFDAASSTVSVQPFPSIYQDGEAVELPALQGVPVTYPAGGGGSDTWPLIPDDVVLVMFSTLPLARFRGEGSDGDPQEIRRFDLSDAWAIPLAAGVPVAATTGRRVITQPTAGKVQVGSGLLTPAAARLGDTVTLTMTTAEVNQFVAAMAQIAATGASAPFAITGKITTGSAVVEVA